jgi:hypothetical protein
MASVIFDVLKGKGLFDSFAEPVSILDMASVIANSGVENVVKGIFSQKKIAQQADAFCMFVIHPHTSEISNCINDLLLFF